MIRKYGWQFAQIAQFMLDAGSAANPEECRSMLIGAKAVIGDLNLPVSRKIMDRVIEESRTPGFDLTRMRHVFEALSDELDGYWFKSLTAEQALLYDSAFPFGESVADRFPDAAVDISEAAKCLALERPAACMFHLMRVMEIGLRGLTSHFGVTVSDFANWGAIISKLKPVIDALPNATDDERRAFQSAQEASACFHAVKLAWRNGTVHPRVIASKEDATSVYQFVRAFMVALASHLTPIAP